MDNQEIRTEEAFQIEKNAKNKAYAFILSNGLQHKFSQFCNENSGIEDMHPFCKTAIKEIETRKSNYGNGKLHPEHEPLKLILWRFFCLK